MFSTSAYCLNPCNPEEDYGSDGKSEEGSASGGKYISYAAYCI